MSSQSMLTDDHSQSPRNANCICADTINQQQDTGKLFEQERPTDIKFDIPESDNNAYLPHRKE